MPGCTTPSRVKTGPVPGATDGCAPAAPERVAALPPTAAAPPAAAPAPPAPPRPCANATLVMSANAIVKLADLVECPSSGIRRAMGMPVTEECREAVKRDGDWSELGVRRAASLDGTRIINMWVPHVRPSETDTPRRCSRRSETAVSTQLLGVLLRMKTLSRCGVVASLLFENGRHAPQTVHC